MTEYLYEELTHAVIGAAIEVHRNLGAGFVEAVYQAALAKELGLRGIPFEEQFPVTVYYKGDAVGQYRADFFVDGKVIVEIKAIKNLTEVEDAQLINYLKGTNVRVGLLLNFGTTVLQKHRRIVWFFYLCVFCELSGF